MRELRDSYVESLGPGARSLSFSRPPSPLARLFVAGTTVAAYVALGSEADPAALLRAASDAGCTTALPHVTGKASPMRFLAWSPGDLLVDGPFGLRQPAATAAEVAPDLILVPLLAFDDALNRLGQGAGHYDRALSLRPNAIAIGVAWSVQQVDALPADPWDAPLDAVLTERSWILPA